MKFSPRAAIASALVATLGGGCSLNGQGELPGASGRAPGDVLADPASPVTPKGVGSPGLGTPGETPGAAAGGSTSGISLDDAKSDVHPDASAHGGGGAADGGSSTDSGADAGTGGPDAAADAKAKPDAEAVGDAGPKPRASGGAADDAAD